jgi:hypothetical protein
MSEISYWFPFSFPTSHSPSSQSELPSPNQKNVSRLKAFSAPINQSFKIFHYRWMFVFIIPLDLRHKNPKRFFVSC